MTLNETQINKPVDPEVVVWQEIIAELCSKAPDQITKDCLRLYDPSKPTKQLTAIFNRCYKNTLVSTLSYLGKPDYDVYNKQQLVASVICRVKNLFPDKCQICEEAYCISIDDDPFLACEICGQEVHKPCFTKKLTENGLMKIEDKTVDIRQIQKIGFHYMCGTCEEDTITCKILKANERSSKSKAENDENQHVEPRIVYANDETHIQVEQIDHEEPLIDEQEVYIYSYQIKLYYTEKGKTRQTK